MQCKSKQVENVAPLLFFISRLAIKVFVLKCSSPTFETLQKSNAQAMADGCGLPLMTSADDVNFFSRLPLA